MIQRVDSNLPIKGVSRAEQAQTVDEKRASKSQLSKMPRTIGEIEKTPGYSLLNRLFHSAGEGAAERAKDFAIWITGSRRLSTGESIAEAKLSSKIDHDLIRIAADDPVGTKAAIEEILQEPSPLGDNPHALSVKDCLEQPENELLREILKGYKYQLEGMGPPVQKGTRKRVRNFVLKHLYRPTTVQEFRGQDGKVYAQKMTCFRGTKDLTIAITSSGSRDKPLTVQDQSSLFEKNRAYPSDMDLGDCAGMEDHVANLAVVYQEEVGGEGRKVATLRHARLVGPTLENSKNRLREAMLLMFLEQWNTQGREAEGIEWDEKDQAYYFYHDFLTHLDTSLTKTLFADNEREMLDLFIKSIDSWPAEGFWVKVKDPTSGKMVDVCLARPLLSHQMASATLRIPKGLGSGRDLSRRFNWIDDQRRFHLFMKRNEAVLEAITYKEVWDKITAFKDAEKALFKQLGITRIDDKTGVVEKEGSPEEGRPWFSSIEELAYPERFMKIPYAKGFVKRLARRFDVKFFWRNQKLKNYEKARNNLIIQMYAKTGSQDFLSLYGVLTGKKLVAKADKIKQVELHGAARIAARMDLARAMKISHSASCRSGCDRTPVGPTYELAQLIYEAKWGKRYDYLNRSVRRSRRTEQDELFSAYWEEALMIHSMPLTTHTRDHWGFRWGKTIFDQNPAPVFWLRKEEINRKVNWDYSGMLKNPLKWLEEHKNPHKSSAIS